MRSKFIPLLVGILSVAVAQAASAADMPVKAPIVKAPIVAPYNWTGLYVGAAFGGGWMRTSDSFSDPGNAAFASCGPCVAPYNSQTLSGTGNGVLGALYLGYNWQFAPKWLAGFEVDLAGTSIKQSSNNIMGTADTPVVLGSNLSFETKVRWLGSLRGRLGLTQDNWLFYATGGVAFANLRFDANAQCPPPAIAGGCVFTSGTTSPLSMSQTRVGYVLGGGLEWQLPASHWRARGEYLFYAFNRSDNGSSQFIAVPGGGPLPCIVTPTCSANYTFGSVTIHTLRAGLSYAF